MEARLYRGVALLAVLLSLGASHRTANFVVTAPTPDMARQIGQMAEKYRRELAIDWLGEEMRTWSQPCPITAQVADNLGAGGATSFLFEHGEVYGWRMTIQGSLVRILDSVLPHEVTHTIFATHFRRPLPRWADEGACTTVEHVSERSKQQMMLVDFLRTDRGIPFSKLFAMKEYPHDVMPLYSQGYSLARYLIAQGGKRKFLDFLSDGMRDENWSRAMNQAYGYQNLAVLQDKWLGWVRQGSPALESPRTRPAELVADNNGSRRGRSQSTSIYNVKNASLPQADDEPTAAARLVPVRSSTARSADSANERLADSRRDRESTERSSDGLQWRGAKARPAGFASRTLQAASRGMRPSSSDAEAAEDALDREQDRPLADDRSQYQVTRPQEMEKSRQVILEWSKPTDGIVADAQQSVYR
jgi:hypothetical protein